MWRGGRADLCGHLQFRGGDKLKKKKKKFKPSWDFLDNMLVLTMKQEDVEVRILTEITFVPAR